MSALTGPRPSILVPTLLGYVTCITVEILRTRSRWLQNVSGGTLSRESGRHRVAVAVGALGLLPVLVVQLALSVRQQSITWDEDDHLYAGYMSWKTGDPGIESRASTNGEAAGSDSDPPMQLKVPPLRGRNFKIEAFLNRKDFLFKNDANTVLFRARIAASLLTVLLVVLVFCAAREMFGTAVAFLALTLLVFDPNLLAHGALVTTERAWLVFCLRRSTPSIDT